MCNGIDDGYSWGESPKIMYLGKNKTLCVGTYLDYFHDYIHEFKGACDMLTGTMSIVANTNELGIGAIVQLDSDPKYEGNKIDPGILSIIDYADIMIPEFKEPINQAIYWANTWNKKIKRRL